MTSATGGNGQAPTRTSSSGSGNGQAPTTPPNNTASSDGGQNGQAPTAHDNETINPPSADEWRRHQQELAEARREAAALRTEKKQRDDAQLSEAQKRERDFTDLQTRSLEQEMKLQRLTLENAGLKLAPSLGISDAAAALALVQVEHAADIKYGDDGNPENLETLLKAVLRNHPALGASSGRQLAPSSGGATNPGRQAGNGGLTREQIQAMPMRERVARIDEITAWEKAQRQQ